jgi:F-type H+-transporting ATPase subunit delta
VSAKNQTTGIAYVYAKALFELACESQQRVEVREELSRLAELLSGTAGLELFFENPSVFRRAKKQLLARAFEGQVSPLIYHFLLVLAAKDRLAWLGSAIKAYNEMDDVHEGRVEGKLVTAVPLSEAEVADVAARFSAKLSKQVKLALVVDPSIIAGMKVEIGGEVYDATVSRDLERFHQRLSERLQSRLLSVD